MRTFATTTGFLILMVGLCPSTLIRDMSEVTAPDPIISSPLNWIRLSTPSDRYGLMTNSTSGRFVE